MALALVGRYIAEADFVTTGSLISLTSLAGGLASQPADGDLIVVSYGTCDTSDAALGIKDASDVDYTLVGSERYSDDNYDANMRTAYKFAGSTPDTQVKISSSPQGYAGIIMVSVWRGVDPSTPLDVAAVQTSGINSPFANPGSITPSTSGAVILLFGAGATGTAAVPYSDPGDLTEFQSLDNDQSGLGGRSTVGGMGYKTWTSGAFDAAQWVTGGGSQFSWVATALALRPEPNAYSLTASAASFILTGAAAALSWGRKIAADAAAFVLTGANASLLAARKIAADAGAFTLTGASAGLLRGLRLAADATSFTLTGASAAFVYGRKIAAEAGSFALTGVNAGLTAARRIAADAGSFALTGAAVTFLAIRKIVAAAASFVITAGTTFLRMPPPYDRTSAGAQQDRDSRSDVQYRTSESEAPEGSRSDVQFRSSTSSSQDRSSR